MKINRYLSRLYDTVLSRGEIQIEAIHIDKLLYPTGQQDSALNNQAEEIKL